MDITRALKDAENALRDFISHTLKKKLGPDWEKQCGVTEQKLEKWQNRKETEKRRQKTGATDERLLYYANFYDLKIILKKHWDEYFSEIFGEWKTTEVFLTELEKLRDSDAHRRELLPHQKALAYGISGEIRTRIMRFRSEQDTGESYFPRIESIRDSLGSMYTIGDINPVQTRKKVKPGDTIDIVITASDPLEEPLQYSFVVEGVETWQDNNSCSLTFETSHIGLMKGVHLTIKSNREFHAHKF